MRWATRCSSWWRSAELREANQQLVLAALSAQELRCAAEQAQQRQAEFMAVVAHELRNPLAPIRIASEMLGRLPAQDPLLPRVQAMVEQHVAQLSGPPACFVCARSPAAVRRRPSHACAAAVCVVEQTERCHALIVAADRAHGVRRLHHGSRWAIEWRGT